MGVRPSSLESDWLWKNVYIRKIPYRPKGEGVPLQHMVFRFVDEDLLILRKFSHKRKTIPCF
jgi:hypothetical protein